MRIPIVDENDNVIAYKDRKDIDYTKDVYRVSCLTLSNSKGEILLAQRKSTKEHDPLKWGNAVAGTVEEGETYESNVYKEAEEELGLTGSFFVRGPKQFVSGTKRRFFVQWFLGEVNKPAEQFIIQEHEVEQVTWIGKQELIQDVKNNPGKYVESMPSVLNLLFK